MEPFGRGDNRAMNFLGTGIYPLPLAARLAGADVRKVRRWLLGYEWRKGDKTQHSDPLWPTQYADEELAQPHIGFQDLLELRMVAAFARHGVSLVTIRATADAARDILKSDYPLTARRFLTDGRRIFLDAIASTGEPRMEDVTRRQYVFRNIITPSLYAGIEYEHDQAKRWFPLGKGKKTIVLDPAIQFGTPVVRSAGVPTDTLYASYLSEGEDAARVARLFEIKAAEVVDAVAFERQYAH